MMKKILMRARGPVAILLAGAVLLSPAAFAQGLQSEGAIDTIVGSDVKTEEKSATEEAGRVAGAIEASTDNAQIVRRAFNIDAVEIVFLPEVGEGDSGITAKREQFADAIQELQVAIESSAIFYHAVDSRQILIRDIVAVEFGPENQTVTIFVAGAAPAQEAPATGEAAPAETAPAPAEAAPVETAPAPAE